MFINDVAFRNDHDGISIESTSPNVGVYNCILMDDGVNAATLGIHPGAVYEIEANSTSGFASNYNCLKGLTTGTADIDPLHDKRHLVKDGINYDDMRLYVTGTGQDNNSKVQAPTFTDTLTTMNFTLASDADSVVDAAKTDITGWMTPMWLSTDARGFVPHDAAMTNLGAGTPAYADIGGYEYDAPPGVPTIVVTADQTGFVVGWNSRGDDGDHGTAGTQEIFVNGSGTGPVGALQPGIYTCQRFEWPTCSPFQTYVKVTERDNGQPASSDVVNGSTACSLSQAATCNPDGRPAPGPGGPSSTVSLGDGAAEPVDYPLSLGLPGPNPAKRLEGITYSIPKALAGDRFELAVFDVSGRRVALVANGVAKAGRLSAQLQSGTGRARPFASGVYFVRLTVGSKQLFKTVFLIP